MKHEIDEDDFEGVIQQTVENLARERGISREDLESVLSEDVDRVREDYMRRYVEVLRREMQIRNISEPELAARLGFEGKQIFDGESIALPETAALLIFRIPLELGIDPVDFTDLMERSH